MGGQVTLWKNPDGTRPVKITSFYLGFRQKVLWPFTQGKYRGTNLVMDTLQIRPLGSTAARCIEQRLIKATWQILSCLGELALWTHPIVPPTVPNGIVGNRSSASGKISTMPLQPMQLELLWQEGLSGSHWNTSCMPKLSIKSNAEGWQKTPPPFVPFRE